MTAAIIVQARMASTRLPGKVMLTVEGRTILEWVLRRCQAIPGADVVCCATVTTTDCDRISTLSKSLGVEVYRGDEINVLDRYRAAADMLDADIVMRVTSDCPVIDPIVCGAVLSARRDCGADYACNNMPSSWPHGLDCEVFTRTALAASIAEASLPEDYEHVTLVLRRSSKFSRISLTGPGDEWERLRWTLDTPDDFAFFARLLPMLPDTNAGTGLIARTLAENPDIVALNAGRSHSAQRVTQQARGIAYTDYMAPMPSISWADILPTT